MRSVIAGCLSGAGAGILLENPTGEAKPNFAYDESEPTLDVQLLVSVVDNVRTIQHQDGLYTQEPRFSWWWGGEIKVAALTTGSGRQR